MRSAKEDEPCNEKSAIDLVSAVEEFHKLNYRELSKLISEAGDGTIQYTKKNGSLLEINMESVARNLALHLISKLLSFKRDEQHLRHLLSGLRLLHAFYDLASRHSNLEQVLFEDVNSLDRILDLVFFIIIFIGNFKQTLDAPILVSSLLASSLYILKVCISSEWQELTNLLLVHPKGDVFTSVAFPAVRVAISFLQVKLSESDTCIKSNVGEVNRVCLDCEASLQFLHSLCLQKLFRQRLVKNKELCKEGNVLWLAQDIMKLPQCGDSNLMAAVTRIKSKILSIMLQLCEKERVSFLDLAARTIQGVDLAKSTVSEVLENLRIMFCGDKTRGILQLNAMRLTKILSDDSNFRSYIVLNFTEVLTTVFLQPHEEFLSNWCSSDSEAVEGDVSLNYDSFSASGQVLGVMSASRGSKSTFTTPPASETPFAHQKTSLLVKILANLTCKEERGLFINKFLQCLQKDLSNLPDGVEDGGGGGSERAAAASRNLRSLFVHAGSLTPELLNKDDLSVLRSLSMQLEQLITPQKNNINRVKEVHKRGKSSSPGPQRSSPDGCNRKEVGSGGRGDDESESESESERDRDDNNKIETIGSYLSNMQLKNDGEEKTVKNEEKPYKKRKRNIMNEVQIGMIENGLRDEPDMQKRAASIQLWADKLSLHGSEVTCSQLKNWLNNRKAKLARAAAAKHASSSDGGDGLTLTLTVDKQGGSVTDHVSDSTEVPGDEPSSHAPPDRKDDVCESVSGFRRKVGEYVVMRDEKGEEVGKGRIHQTRGTWFDVDLVEMGVCVVDVRDLKVDETSELPHPCDATGTSFREAQVILGKKRILWDSTKLTLHPTPLPHLTHT